MFLGRSSGSVSDATPRPAAALRSAWRWKQHDDVIAPPLLLQVATAAVAVLVKKGKLKLPGAGLFGGGGGGRGAAVRTVDDEGEFSIEMRGGGGSKL